MPIAKFVANQRGQALVETVLSIFLMTAIFFAAVQFYLIAVGWMRANEAAQAAVRVAIVTPGATESGAQGKDPKTRAQFAGNYVLGAGLPAQVKLWSRQLNGNRSVDHSSGRGARESDNEDAWHNGLGAHIRMFSAHAYYFQKLMMGSRFFRGISSGIGNVRSLSVGKDHKGRGAAHCRMVKSPDWLYYNRAYPAGKKFNE